MLVNEQILILLACSWRLTLMLAAAPLNVLTLPFVQVLSDFLWIPSHVYTFSTVVPIDQVWLIQSVRTLTHFSPEVGRVTMSHTRLKNGPAN